MDLRRWIDLPEVPPELLEQAYDDDDLATILNRRRLLFSYFGASTETKEEAERLAFAVVAFVFPAFRPRSAQHSKRPGRHPSIRPKYEVQFLRRVAAAYDSTKRQVKSNSTVPTQRIYEIFKKEYPILANQLQVGGKPLTLGSFKKLLAVGRSACKHEVIWHKDFLNILPFHLKRSGNTLC
jgi:hypothetical protein